MAILSLFAITLLSSAHAHALDLPSSSKVMERLQRSHSSLNAEVLASTQKLFAPMRSIPQHVQQSRASPLQRHIMQDIDEAACTAAMEASCVAGFDGFGAGVLLADAAAAAVTVAEQFCTETCNDSAAQYETYITACGLTDEDATTANLQRDLIAAVCVDATCAANAVWGSLNPTERREALCPNVECGLPVLRAASLGMLNSTELECQESALELTCLTDEADSSVYCTDYYLGEVNISAVCATTCPGYLTLLTQEYQEQCMNMDDDDSETPTGEDEDCDFEFTLNDMCTQNDDNVYCQDFFAGFMETGPNVTECGFDDVPAPGVEEVERTECSSECQVQLEAFGEDGGCCTGLFFEMLCVDSSISTFIETTCGVTYETCVSPPLPTTPVTETEDPDLTTDAAAIGVSAAVTSVLAIAALAALS